MTPQFDFKQPKTLTEADSLLGVASTDLFATLVQRHNLAINERNGIERKHAEISGLLTQADFMKYQLSRL